MNASLRWRSFVRYLENFDLENKIRHFRRYPKRRIVAITLVILFFIYVFSSSSKLENSMTKEQRCSAEKLKHLEKSIQDFDVAIADKAVKFIGNGYFGIDQSGQLKLQNAENSRVLDSDAEFYPSLTIDIDSPTPVSETTITDFQNGMVKNMKCFTIDDECASVISVIYAHRTRPNIFVQSIQISNPTKSTVRLNLNRITTNWWAHSMLNGITVHQRPIGNQSYAVVCNDPPGRVIVSQKREEILKFICIILSKKAGDDNPKDIKMAAVQLFNSANELKTLDEEHKEGWAKLNSFYFKVESSKAPNTLNADRINATKYILLSNLRSPTIEAGVTPERVKEIETLSRKNELCYTGHSNMLYPSRLWKDWNETNQIVEIVKTWILTFEKRGCHNLLSAGALGVSQAFVQSLTASSYHDSHLEIALDAHDLHREMSFGGIPVHNNMGSVGRIHVDIKLDNENRPYFMVSSTNHLFACDGGCLDRPVTLGKIPLKMPVKVTKPVTSLLYIATNRRHLEQLKSAIHVSDVGSAPAHEDEIIELHRSGESSGGLPTSFWVFLVVILILFHLFLAKIFWSEWRKGDMTPYNPYLRNRYSSLRPH